MKVAAALIVILALVIGITGQFTDCQSQGKAITLANGKTIPMKCHWTSMAELGLALPLAMVGGLMAVSRRRESQRNLSLMGVGLGAVAILIPTVLIGVCSSGMSCEIVLRPALILAGTLVVAISAVTFILSLRPEPETSLQAA
jgi:hypothetical protein